MKKLLIGGAIVVILVITSLVIFRHKETKPEYKTQSITRGTIATTVTASGTVNAISTISVGTQVSGTIKHIYADFNSPVKKGRLIALIDPTTFETRVQQAKADLLSARAGLEKAKSILLNAKRTMDRNTKLFSKNLIARSDLDTSDTNYKISKAEVTAAVAQIAQAEAALKYAEINLRYTKILSPVNGVVISRNVDVGQTVAASFQTPTLFTIARDLTKMQIDTNVDEADIGNIKAGQDAEFSVDAYPGITFKGSVWQVRIAPITVQNVVTYDAVIRVDNPGLKLKPGMTANVSIITARKKDVLRIPNAALRFMPAGRYKVGAGQRGYGVWIIENGKLRRIKVKTGISDGNYTELISGDIKEGREVIIRSLTTTNKQAGRGMRRIF
ncbi:MAG TPA: efflux RND transporter periplasmic adaptor subunit [Nitrospirae bacterium]|nr:efflux RND transporter periplasmic adaptor subunit [Nitrospirota bacterium]